MTTKSAQRMMLSGNEAIARGAIEAGISLATSYPGTPATEILPYVAQHFTGEGEWAINEKVAYETAVGASYAGKRALCSMKHVGVNVAADPLMTSAYLGIKGGLVLVVADDPGACSSQNEQDSRFYARFAKIPCFEPADAQETKDMTKSLRCTLLPVNAEPTGDFAHPPAPTAANMRQIASLARCFGADLGAALNVDGDRVGFVTGEGTALSEE